MPYEKEFNKVYPCRFEYLCVALEWWLYDGQSVRFEIELSMLIRGIVEYFLSKKDVKLHLIPHVVVESVDLKMITLLPMIFTRNIVMKI